MKHCRMICIVSLILFNIYIKQNHRVRSAASLGSGISMLMIPSCILPSQAGQVRLLKFPVPGVCADLDGERLTDSVLPSPSSFSCWDPPRSGDFPCLILNWMHFPSQSGAPLGYSFGLTAPAQSGCSLRPHY